MTKLTDSKRENMVNVNGYWITKSQYKTFNKINDDSEAVVDGYTSDDGEIQIVKNDTSYFVNTRGKIEATA